MFVAWSQEGAVWQQSEEENFLMSQLSVITNSNVDIADDAAQLLSLT